MASWILVNIGSDYGLLCGQHQAITWTIFHLLSIRALVKLVSQKQNFHKEN